jgi:hypothetical protein
MRVLPGIEQSWRKFAPVAKATHSIDPTGVTAKNSAGFLRS